MSNCRRKVLANQFEVRGVVEDVETERSCELFVDACDELLDFVVRRNLQAFCDLQEGGGEALPRNRRDPEGVVVVAPAFEAVEDLYRQLSLSYASRAYDRLDDDRLGARRERLEEFAEFFPPPGEVADDVGRDQRFVLLRERTGDGLASERIARGRRFSVSAAQKSEITHVDELPHASPSIREDVDAMTQSTPRQESQASRRFLRVGEASAQKRNRRHPGERSHAFQNPPREVLSHSEDLHTAMSLDLKLADLLGLSLSKRL